MYKITNNLLVIDCMKYFTFRQCNANLRYAKSAQNSAITNTCSQCYFYRNVSCGMTCQKTLCNLSILMFLKRGTY